jgi:hypothetical protein
MNFLAEGENVELKAGGISISQSNVQALLSALEEAMILKLKDLMRVLFPYDVLPLDGQHRVR